ncbi:MAG: dynamin family protein, partial [Kiritimatiellae bacterium]|nr:dynamin family protein [Kiritimatiellia bacterium]
MGNSEELNLDDLLSGGYELPPGNRYISDSGQAVSFVASLLREGKKEEFSGIARQFRQGVEKLFQKFQSITLPNELVMYRRFLTLGERLRIIQKVTYLTNKVIVGFGGKFSAGKSSFINSIAGLVDILPEAQEPTTSIPTYIIKAQNERMIANTIFGEAWGLSREAMEALTHEFQRKYT